MEVTRRSEDSDRAARKAMITTDTWVDLVDWNGDGRVDIVDARDGDANTWRVWINHYDAGLVRWQAIDVDISPIRAYLLSSEQIGWAERVPIKRSRTWTKLWSSDCRGWTCGFDDGWWQCEPEEDCPTEPDMLKIGGTDTVTEWMLADWNGDSFPDFMAANQPIEECEWDWRQGGLVWPNCPSVAPTVSQVEGLSPGFFGCTTYHSEWIADGSCPGSSPVVCVNA